MWELVLTKGSCKLAALPHWRGEVKDVANTLQMAAISSGREEVRWITPVQGLVLLGTRSARRLAVLVSDAADPLLRPRWAWGRPGYSFRIWWNQSDEVVTYLDTPLGRYSRSRETHLCFFPELAVDLRDLGLPVLSVPYAFSRPVGERDRFDGAEVVSTATVCFIGEVDISDVCFQGLVDGAGSQIHQ